MHEKKELCRCVTLSHMPPDIFTHQAALTDTHTQTLCAGVHMHRAEIIKSSLLRAKIASRSYARLMFSHVCVRLSYE